MKGKLIYYSRRVLPFALLLSVLVVYQGWMGQMATRAAAKSAIAFSQLAALRWQLMAQALEVAVGQTGEGQLLPIVPANRSALDLVMYGEQVVTSPYKAAFESLQFANVTDRAFIYVNSDKLLSYAVAGMDVIGLEAASEHQIAVFFNHVTVPVLKETNRLVDGASVWASNDTIGNVKHVKTAGGQYIMGLYVDVTSKKGADL